MKINFQHKRYFFASFNREFDQKNRKDHPIVKCSFRDPKNVVIYAQIRFG